MIDFESVFGKPFGATQGSRQDAKLIDVQLRDEPCNCPGCSEEAMHRIQPLYLRVRGA